MTIGVTAALADFVVDPGSPHSVAVQKALFLARRLQERSAALQTPSERRQQAELDRMLQEPRDKATLMQLTDQAFRSHRSRRAVDHLVHILDVQGVPRFFTFWDRTMLRGFKTFGGYLPGVAMPFVKEHMHKETANVILPGEREMLTHHLRQRQAEGVRMNVNFLGEAILGEQEAEARFKQYLTALQWPEIEVVSIKISTLYSQISPLAREQTVAVLCDRLERMFRTAAHMRFTRPDGRRVPKFVYLDMEEYRDKDLTAQAFMRTLDRPGLEAVSAGIALQSYIPDSLLTLREIQAWARRRVAAGGGRVTVRLVKGANMETERVEASLRGWPQAPYTTKRETDANFKRLLHETMKPENLAAMDVGVASHNLFDLSYALVLAEEAGATGKIQAEMLEGMANQQRRAVFERCPNVLLYAPACPKESFTTAIGYLIRRLDENTGDENFLRYVFRLEVDGPAWRRLEQGFLDSFEGIDSVSDQPRRTQDRRLEPGQPQAVADGWQHLVNESDTDFSLPGNSLWAREIVQRWQSRCGERAAEVPLVVAGEEVRNDRPVRESADPSRTGVVVARYRQATEKDIERAVRCADEDPDGWRTMSPDRRFDVMGRAAQEIRKARGDLIGSAMADGGKTVSESDPEVSEAVDFVEFYRAVARWWQERPSLRAQGLGVAVVVSPWNFPIAIPCGGVAAALAAGNTVILKPASDTVLPAWELCQCFWRAGVSKRTLQFLPCSGSAEGRSLVNHPKVRAVILTGGTATAQAMLADNPRMNLYAETGGKDATIVTGLSDRDQAVKHVIHSAFSHSGQKCSATSLLLLEAEVYDDPQFRRALCDAAASMKVAPAWELDTRMGPLVRPPSGDLQEALHVLEEGEEWALMPRRVGDSPTLFTPGIKYGVQPGSYTHMTEFFGPVLAVMRFETLAQAVDLVNQTGYGLTSGLESLDDREWEYWIEHLRAGNLYVNRSTTGAIVLRQPFGGFGKSVFGPGLKAGGPNYVTQLMDLAEAANPSLPGAELRPALAELCDGLDRRAGELGDAGPGQADRIRQAAGSYEQAWQEEFSRGHDHFLLIGQDNLRRYLPLGWLCVRVHESDSPFELLARVCAAHVAGARVTVSVPPGVDPPGLRLLEELTEPWAGAIEFAEQSDRQVADLVRAHAFDRVRYAAPDRVPLEVLQAAGESGVAVIARPVLADGRAELLWYLQEQSVSIDYHRYGNLGIRSSEPRAQPQ